MKTKFKMKCKVIGDEDSNAWWEEYLEETENPQQWAESTINKFNAGLRPDEKPRILLDLIVIEEEIAPIAPDMFAPKRMVKISMYGAYCIETSYELAIEHIALLIDENGTEDSFTVEIIIMNQDEFDALDEFAGW